VQGLSMKKRPRRKKVGSGQKSRPRCAPTNRAKPVILGGHPEGKPQVAWTQKIRATINTSYRPVSLSQRGDGKKKQSERKKGMEKDVPGGSSKIHQGQEKGRIKTLPESRRGGGKGKKGGGS